jgi:hypothetical protein
VTPSLCWLVRELTWLDLLGLSAILPHPAQNASWSSSSQGFMAKEIAQFMA